MTFTVGDDVIVLPLKRKGRVVEVGGKRRYKIALGAIVSWHDEADLSAVAGERGRAKRRKGPGDVSQGGSVLWERQDGAARLATLDLHGLTVEEALRVVESRLDEAIRAGLEGVEIIHGIGGGRLRGAVHKYLRSVPSVSSFSLDVRNPGVTRVFF